MAARRRSLPCLQSQIIGFIATTLFCARLRWQIRFSLFSPSSRRSYARVIVFLLLARFLSLWRLPFFLRNRPSIRIRQGAGTALHMIPVGHCKLDIFSVFTRPVLAQLSCLPAFGSKSSKTWISSSFRAGNRRRSTRSFAGGHV